MRTIVKINWDWLRDEHNREALKLVGATIAVLVAAGWALFIYFNPNPDPDIVIEVVVNVREVQTRKTPSVTQYHTGQGGSFSNWVTVGNTSGWQIIGGSTAQVVESRTATGGGVQFARIETENTASAVKVRAYAQPTSRHHGVTIVGHAKFREERIIESSYVLDSSNKTLKFNFSEKVVDVQVATKYSDGESNVFRGSGEDSYVQVSIDLDANKILIRKKQQ